MPQSKHLRLSPEQRRQLAEVAGCDPGKANPDLDQLETILSDHQFTTGVFETPKPNEVRERIAPRKGAGLSKQARALAQALGDLPWQLAAEFRVQGFNVPDFREQAERFIAASEAVLASYAGETTVRRERQRMRDRHTIPTIADLFDRLCGRDDDLERDWEHTDRECAFVALALDYAGIPCPAAGDTRLGEVRQGRLRRLLKAHHQNKRRNRVPDPSQRAAGQASPALTD
jgi:hypothetical protein